MNLSKLHGELLYWEIKIGDLVESNQLVNLNEPCKIEDPSWIKPGKSLWDWRVWGYITKGS